MHPPRYALGPGNGAQGSEERGNLKQSVAPAHHPVTPAHHGVTSLGSPPNPHVYRLPASRSQVYLHPVWSFGGEFVVWGRSGPFILFVTVLSGRFVFGFGGPISLFYLLLEGTEGRSIGKHKDTFSVRDTVHYSGQKTVNVISK